MMEEAKKANFFNKEEKENKRGKIHAGAYRKTMLTDSFARYAAATPEIMHIRLFTTAIS